MEVLEQMRMLLREKAINYQVRCHNNHPEYHEPVFLLEISLYNHL